VLSNRIKTNKNPDENPDLPIDFENLHCKPKVLDFRQMFVISKNKSRTSGKKTMHRLDLGVKNL
jgi:hypothetical protein